MAYCPSMVSYCCRAGGFQEAAMCCNAFTSFLLLHAALRVVTDLKWQKYCILRVGTVTAAQAVFGLEKCDKVINV